VRLSLQRLLSRRNGDTGRRGGCGACGGRGKLTHEDKAKSFAAIGTAVDLFQIEQLREMTRQSQPVPAGSREAVFASPLPEEADADGSQRSFFMDIYAANSRAYMQSSGATREDSPRSP
jgi:hypothetical protein